MHTDKTSSRISHEYTRMHTKRNGLARFIRFIRVHPRAFVAKSLVFSSVALLSSCGRYANFTLPPTAGGDTSLVFRFLPQAAPVIPRGEFHDALPLTSQGFSSVVASKCAGYCRDAPAWPSARRTRPATARILPGEARQIAAADTAAPPSEIQKACV